MGSSDQQFCLRWNNHQTNLLSVFDQLLQNESFVDVTLACDGLSLKAHKVVLSACSPYFQSLLLENPCQHPIVILKDVGYPDLKALVDFMYKGEVNVSQEQLTALLKTAEMLKVKGLSEVCPNRPLSPHRKDGGQVRVTVSASSGSPARCETSGTPRPPHAVSPHVQNQSPGHPGFGRLSSVSPPSKRKKGWPRRRSGGGSSSGPSDAEDNGGVTLDSSPEVVETKVEMTGVRSDGQSSSTMPDHHRQPSEAHSAPSLVHASTAAGQVEDKNQCLESSNVLSMPGFTPIMSQGPTQQQQQQQQQQHQYQPPPAAAVSTHTPPAAWSRRRRSPVLDGPLRCGICAKVISSACNFRKHMEVHNPVRQFYPCPLCQRGYNRKDNLSWHLKHKHGVPTTQRRLQPKTSAASLADDEDDEGPGGPGLGHHVGDYT